MNHKYAHGLLTAALLTVFLYFGIDKFSHPTIWIGFLPLWMNGLLGLSAELWLPLIGAVEILLALLLLFPVRKVRQVACILIALHLLAIITIVGWNDIGARDAALMLSALALLFLE